MLLMAIGVLLGSSPHTWRIPIEFHQNLPADRIISTYVENTSVNLIIFIAYKDHLHIRGEYTTFSSKELGYMGSSPHTWRIQLSVISMILTERIISTYVENTCILGLLSCTFKDHLHIRGEYSNG